MLYCYVTFAFPRLSSSICESQRKVKLTGSVGRQRDFGIPLTAYIPRIIWLVAMYESQTNIGARRKKNNIDHDLAQHEK